MALVTLSACDEPATRGRVITASYARLGRLVRGPSCQDLEARSIAYAIAKSMVSSAEALAYSRAHFECESEWASQALRACGSKHGAAREACVATVFPFAGAP